MQLLSVNNSQVPLYKSNSTQTVNTAVSSATLTKIAEWTGLTGDTDDVYQIDLGIKIITFESEKARAHFEDFYLKDLGAMEYTFTEVENFDEGCMEWNLELV